MQISSRRRRLRQLRHVGRNAPSVVFSLGLLFGAQPSQTELGEDNARVSCRCSFHVSRIPHSLWSRPTGDLRANRGRPVLRARRAIRGRPGLVCPSRDKTAARARQAAILLAKLAKRLRRSHAHKEKFQSPKLVVRKRRHAQTVLAPP